MRHTFDLTLAQIHDDGYTLARPALFLLALLEPAPVPRVLLTPALLTPALLTDATGQQATAAELDAALAALHQYGLINTPAADGGGGEPLTAGQISLHPLVHDVIALTPPPGTDHAACRSALDTHLTQTVRDTTGAGRAGWPTARLLAPHLPPLLRHTPNAGFTTTRDLLDTLADTLHDAGAAAEEHLLRQSVLNTNTRHLGPDHPDSLVSRNNLAIAIHGLGQYQEAADLFQRTLTTRERLMGSDHPDTLSSRNSLAGTLYGLGRHHEAVDLQQQNLTTCERILGPDHPHTQESRNNLADTLSDLGRHHEAVDLHQQNLTIRERVHGPDHPHTQKSRNSLAAAREEMARTQRRRLPWQRSRP
ncbi:tetratricopeptide repeat protein [Streptomyces niveus]|uniref:tetratricopeptide repeat protein n=1 Tax=Streptomyces niveus TaxID=193462 RepID=UPI00364951B0